MFAWRDIWRFAGFVDDVRGRVAVLWWLLFIATAALALSWVTGVRNYGAVGTALLLSAAVLFIVGLSGLIDAGRRRGGSQEPIERVMPRGGQRLRLRVDATGLEFGDADDRGSVKITLPISITNREPTPVHLEIRLVFRREDARHHNRAMRPDSGYQEPLKLEGHGFKQLTMSFQLSGHDVVFFGTIYDDLAPVGGARRRPGFPDGSLAVSLEDYISGGKEVIDLPIYEPVDVELPSSPAS